MSWSWNETFMKLRFSFGILGLLLVGNLLGVDGSGTAGSDSSSDTGRSAASSAAKLAAETLDPVTWQVPTRSPRAYLTTSDSGAAGGVAGRGEKRARSDSSDTDFEERVDAAHVYTFTERQIIDTLRSCDLYDHRQHDIYSAFVGRRCYADSLHMMHLRLYRAAKNMAPLGWKKSAKEMVLDKMLSVADLLLVPVDSNVIKKDILSLREYREAKRRNPSRPLFKIKPDCAQAELVGALENEELRTESDYRNLERQLAAKPELTSDRAFNCELRKARAHHLVYGNLKTMALKGTPCDDNCLGAFNITRGPDHALERSITIVRDFLNRPDRR